VTGQKSKSFQTLKASLCQGDKKHYQFSSNFEEEVGDEAGKRLLVYLVTYHKRKEGEWKKRRTRNTQLRFSVEKKAQWKSLISISWLTEEEGKKQKQKKQES